MQPVLHTPSESPSLSDCQFAAFKEMGDRYTGEGKYDQACECYNRAAAICPGEVGPYVGLGTVAIRTDRLDLARECFDLALQLQGDCAEAYAGLAMVYQHSDQHDQAFEMYLKCLELDDQNLVALLGLFQTSCQMGSFSKIIYYLQVYLDKHPDDTSVLFCLASLYVKEGRLPEARNKLISVLAIEPQKSEAAALLEEVEADLRSSSLADEVALR